MKEHQVITILYLIMLLTICRAFLRPRKVGSVKCHGLLPQMVYTKEARGSRSDRPASNASRNRRPPAKQPDQVKARVKLTEPEIDGPYAVITMGKSRLFKSGNPLIFAGVIEAVKGDPKPGQIVSVLDHNFNVFAKGFYNPYSQYRLRLIVWKDDEKVFNSPIETMLRLHLQTAIRKRNLLGLPSKVTNSYRLVNGEGDKLSGLMVDVLGEHVIVQSSAIWIEMHADMIINILQDLLKVSKSNIVWRHSTSRLEKDGMAMVKDVVTSHGCTSEVSDTVIVENEIKYALTKDTEQKTGFYCDQRENRKVIKDLSTGKTVLDAYCYTGGFMLNSLVGGASHVTAIDSSKVAIAAARKNVLENSLDDQKVRFEEGDAVAVMNRLYSEGLSYDIVICDPPKLAPQRKVLEQATFKYQSINVAGMKLVKQEGGLMLTCTCSAAMTESLDTFMKMLSEASKEAKRDITVLSVSNAAADHVLSPAYQEGKYLTAVLLYVQ